MSSLAWMAGLTFKTLREANAKRLPEFRNAKGEYAHKRADGSDWSLGDWMTAVVGEVGEAANLIKKVARGDMTLDTVLKTNPDDSTVTVRDELAHELADVQTYLDILAFRAGIDLGDATIRKFNIVSQRVGSGIRIQPDGLDWAYHQASAAAPVPQGFDSGPKLCQVKNAPDTRWFAMRYTGANADEVMRFCGSDAEMDTNKDVWVKHLSDKTPVKLGRGNFIIKERDDEFSVRSSEYFAMFFEAESP